MLRESKALFLNLEVVLHIYPLEGPIGTFTNAAHNFTMRLAILENGGGVFKAAARVGQKLPASILVLQDCMFTTSFVIVSG